ncbi:MAG: transglutaminase domain-containing protein, partial [Gammaproteobacteria bacterium]|nr:transglutaminase domain-containing protein [Gammaproteobacteria bacterium]
EMKLPHLKNLCNASDKEAAEFIIHYITTVIPKSSSKLALKPEGYPSDGEIEVTIRQNQIDSRPLETALKALETGCGNCQEMAYAAALILRQSGYQRRIDIGQFGINHQFLFVGDLIVDPWAGMYCSATDWKDNLFGYGGRNTGNIMHARQLSSDHFELEDEEPVVVEAILTSITTGLSSENFAVDDEEQLQASSPHQQTP